MRVSVFIDKTGDVTIVTSDYDFLPLAVSLDPGNEKLRHFFIKQEVANVALHNNKDENKRYGKLNLCG
jgi:hypothetical protein